MKRSMPYIWECVTNLQIKHRWERYCKRRSDFLSSFPTPWSSHRWAQASLLQGYNKRQRISREVISRTCYQKRTKTWRGQTQTLLPLRVSSRPPQGQPNPTSLRWNYATSLRGTKAIWNQKQWRIYNTHRSHGNREPPRQKPGGYFFLQRYFQTWWTPSIILLVGRWGSFFKCWRKPATLASSPAFEKRKKFFLVLLPKRELCYKIGSTYCYKIGSTEVMAPAPPRKTIATEPAAALAPTQNPWRD